ncbi:Appr-1-p processing protein [Rubrivivax gelatinosus]|nr:Appr-1-p processing protein [Rubrivivax gelatinosus]
MIKLAQGDLLKQDDVDAIVNTVNCVGVMGKGIALQFKNKWPANFDAYAAACKAGLVRTGRMFVFDSGGLVKPNFIINFPTKDHWRGSSSIDFIRDGLVDLVSQVRRLGIRSLAMPPLGCGNGGLDWADVRPLIEAAFAEIPDVELRLFEPAGAPEPKTMEVRTRRPRMTPGRAAIVKMLDTYRGLNYGLSRIEVQKLAYFLQEAGGPLALHFVKHHYGPYSDQLRHALNTMDGHFIRGMGDGTVEAEIEPTEDALAEAEAFIAAEQSDLAEQVARVGRLIEGYQSSYGMELLASVHWVATREHGVESSEDALVAVQAWNERKRHLMKREHVAVAWQRLQDEGWLKPVARRLAHAQAQADLA